MDGPLLLDGPHNQPYCHVGGRPAGTAPQSIEPQLVDELDSWTDIFDPVDGLAPALDDWYTSI